MSAVACRSLSVSYGNALTNVGLAASELAAANSVCPSGAAFTTSPAAKTPPAPARFSTTTALPNCSCSRPAIDRTTTSMLPPAGNDTMKVIGPDGNSAARAGKLVVTQAPARIPSIWRRVGISTVPISAAVYMRLSQRRGNPIEAEVSPSTNLSLNALHDRYDRLYNGGEAA